MKDAGLREPFLRECLGPVPCRRVLLTAPPERAPPEVDNMVAKCGQRALVRRHGMVVEPTRDDPPQPQALSRDRQVHARSEPRLDLLELRPHAVASALALQGEAALARFAADEGASRPTGFRRQPLLDPCMNLSAHTAPIRRTCRSCRYASERTGSSSPGPAFVENGWRVFCEP